MLTFTQYLTEQTDYDFRALFQDVKTKSGFKGGFFFFPSINPNTTSIKMKYATNKADLGNTLDNDALDITLRISVDGSGAFVVEFLNTTATIKPDTPNRVFGRHKFALRKITAKSEADITKKLVKFVQTVMDDTKQLLADGKFEVYNGSAKVYDDAYINVIKHAVNA